MDRLSQNHRIAFLMCSARNARKKRRLECATPPGNRCQSPTDADCQRVRPRQRVARSLHDAARDAASRVSAPHSQ